MRHRHKPFELEVIVDHRETKNQHLVTRQKRDTQNDSNQEKYIRFLWYSIIFLGTLISLFYLTAEFLLDAFENLTRNWTPVQRALGISSAFLIFTFVWILFFPTIKKQQSKKMKKLDNQILEVVCNILDGINNEGEKIGIIRCWSCFNEIDRSDQTCPSCREKQG